MRIRYALEQLRVGVTLVDTSGKGVDRVTEHGVVVDGGEYAVDFLIFATGFEVGTAYPSPRFGRRECGPTTAF